jgi:hypothetical protein
MLRGLVTAVDDLAEIDPDALSDAELSTLMVEGRRQQARLDAQMTRLSGAWDSRRCFDADEAKTGAAWLAERCRVPIGAARRQLHHARMLRRLPHVEAAFVAGEIGTAQVRALCGAVNLRTEARFADDEKLLVDHAKTLRFADFVRAMRYWLLLADPDGAERDADAAHAGRSFGLYQSLDGTWVGELRLPPVQGAIVADGLGRIERELFQAEWAEAKSRLGDLVSVDALRRTPAQRRADALVELVTRAGAAPPGSLRPAPLFTVLVGYETLAGPVSELANQRTVLTPGQLAPWISEADIERVVFDSPSRIIDIGRRQRFFRGAARRLVEVRDRRCGGFACDVPAPHCHIDHVQPWNGENTTTDNGQPRCGWHNRRKGDRPPPPSDDDSDGDLGDNDQPATGTAA